MAKLPFISVILVFGDERGRADHLASWTQQQTLEGDRFEVIAVTTGEQSSQADEIRSYLRPQDRLLCFETNKPFELIAPAVKVSTGDILFFSEDHCIAEPDCLETTLDYMENTNTAGASVRWGHINPNSFAVMEQRLADRDLASWIDGDSWNRLRLRGFFISREAYLDAGGFEGPYEQFSEVLLAARLHASGNPIGYLDKGGINHINTSTFGELFSNVWKYAYNECRFCDEGDAEMAERYFAHALLAMHGASGDSATRAALKKATGAVLRRILSERPVRRWSEIAGLSLTWFRLVSPYLLGARGRQWSAYAMLYMAQLRVIVWRNDDDRRLRAFIDFWMRGAECARADYMAGGAKRRFERLPVWRGHGLDVAALGAAGCHGVETHNGTTFFWTQPACQFVVDQPPADCRMTIRTAGFRNLRERLPIGLFWNDNALPDPIIDGDRISVPVSSQLFASGAEQRLTVVVPPLSTPGTSETRKLGLPICALQFEPA